MPLTITDAFDLPSPEEITPLGFVIRLQDEDDQAKTRRLAADYVLTPTVREALPQVLAQMRHVLESGGELGHFIHGSFGSGKSHFMSFLALLLEGSAAAWTRDDALIRKLDDDHRAWIRDARLLMVRVHMLTADQTDAGFDRAVYQAFNRALSRHGKPLFEFVDVDGILAEARHEANLYGDSFWKNLENASIVGSKAEFEAIAGGDLEEREDFARAFLAWKKRDAASAGLNPNWADGLVRVAQHAKDHGFGGIVFLVDELLLWLSAKSGPEFKRAINQLNVMVDHTSGRRALPLFAFVARQRNISEFFPDLVQEDELHQHLDYNAKRFHVTTLGDVELRHICRGRVLKRREPDVVEPVLAKLVQRHEKILPALLQKADADYLRDVYPFHPALIEMLIDVSTLMQRERTALKMLYELLVLHNPTLPLGEFVPVGRAFEAIFPELGVAFDGTKRAQDLKKIHELYYQRFSRAMGEMARGPDFSEKRLSVLAELVKTALLAEISPRLKGATGMTVERLVQLNDAEIEGETGRGAMLQAHQDLVELSKRVPALQITGTGRNAIASVVLQGVNFGELMERARRRFDQPQFRFKPFYKLFKKAVGLEGKAGFGDGDGNEGTITVKWRNTQRRGAVAIRNVRELQNADFKPRDGHEFKILIDYPWDDVGETVEKDRQRARDVKKRDGQMATICWLPRHFTPAELEELVDYAAAEFLLTAEGQDEFLKNLSSQDRQQVLDQATNRAAMMAGKLQGVLRSAYKDHGQCEALISDIPDAVPNPELERNIDAFATSLLDRQYPSHPHFSMDPKPDDLARLCDWLVGAWEAPEQTLPFDDATGKVLRGLGQPLDLVDPGQTRGRLRTDTRYVKAVLERANAESVQWTLIDTHLEKAYGLQLPVRNMFLALLARAHSYRALGQVTGEAVDLKIDNKPKPPTVLQRAPLLTPAEWSLLRAFAPIVLDVEPPGLRTLAEQDRYADVLRASGGAKRASLSELHQQLAGLGLDEKAARPSDIREALRRLAPLTSKSNDSCAVLRELLAQWPEEQGDPVRTVVKRLADVKKALGAINNATRGHLLRAVDNAVEGATARAHLGLLDALASAREQEKPLTEQAVRDWNRGAEAILERILEQLGRARKPPSEPPRPEPPRPDPQPYDPRRPVPERFDAERGDVPLRGPARAIPLLQGAAVRLRDAESLEGFFRDLRKELLDIDADAVEIDVTVHPKRDS